VTNIYIEFKSKSVRKFAVYFMNSWTKSGYLKAPLLYAEYKYVGYCLIIMLCPSDCIST